MSATFWLPPIQKASETESKKIKAARVRQDSSSSSSSESSSASSSSESSTSSSSSESSSAASLSSQSKKQKSSKAEKKTEELEAIYEDFMPAEEEEQVTQEASKELASPEVNESLREVLQRLNKDLDTFSKLKSQLKQAPKTDPVPAEPAKPQPGPSQPVKKRKVTNKKELNKLRRERDQLRKKVLGLTKIGQNYQSKLNTFFAELSKQDQES